MIKSIEKNKTLLFGVFTYISISLLIIFYNHHYYDDEIFNLSKMSWSFSKIYIYIQNHDVHPPLSYLINKSLYNLFFSYKAILIFSIIINVLALGYFYKFAKNKLRDNNSKVLLFLFVFINGGLLLWTNSVRWYAYWTPLFIILYTFLLKNRSLTSQKIINISMLLSVMTYINYLTFLLIVGLAIFFIFFRSDNINIKNIIIFCLTYFFLSASQIFFFITVHMHNKESQVSSALNSFLNAIYGILNGGSVFIADPIFLLFSIFTFLILIFGFKRIFIYRKEGINFFLLQNVGFLMILSFLMITTGVSGKYRNNIALSIPFYFIVSYFFYYIKNKKFKYIYLALALVLSVESTYNLISHANTSKNSYNMPIAKLEKRILPSNKNLIFSHDPVISFYFSTKGYKVYDLARDKEDKVIPKDTNLYLVKTYQGSLSDQEYQKIVSLYKSISNKIDELKKEKVGIDRYANIKNKLPGNRPKIDQVQIYLFSGKLRDNLHIDLREKIIKEN